MELFERFWDLDESDLVGQMMDSESIRDHASAELGADLERVQELVASGQINVSG